MAGRKLTSGGNGNAGHELDMLGKWQRIQERLLALGEHMENSHADSIRSAIDQCIQQETSGAARIWWEPVDVKIAMESGTLHEVCFLGRRYGMLKLKPDYLESSAIRGIPQLFASLCGLILALAEHQRFVSHQLRQLSPLGGGPCVKLTGREEELLWSLLRGENERQAAQHMCIAVTTVRAHRQRLYSALNVHSAAEAVSRSFALKLVDWLGRFSPLCDSISEEDAGTS